jgi:hypothetical protein
MIKRTYSGYSGEDFTLKIRAPAKRITLRNLNSKYLDCYKIYQGFCTKQSFIVKGFQQILYTNIFYLIVNHAYRRNHRKRAWFIHLQDLI